MKKVALIGVGRMGAGIASCLLKNKVSLTIYNRSPEKCKPFITQGAKLANTISEAVSAADIIISCLLDDAVVREVSLGKNGILENSKEDAIHIGTATILPKTAELVFNNYKAENRSYISAAVLGRAAVAYEGKLTTFYAANKEEEKQIKPILDLFSEKCINFGANPQAPLVMKIIMNYSLVTTLELISEVYAFAESSGLDLDIVQQQLHQVYAHPAFKHYIDKIKNHNFDEVNFDSAGGLKDVNVFQKAFSDVGVPPYLGNLLEKQYHKALENNMGQKDWSSIYEIIRKESGLKD